MTATAEQPPIGRGGGHDGATAAATTTVAAMPTTTTPIAERERTTHHWTMVGGRGSGGWVTMLYSWLYDFSRGLSLPYYAPPRECP